MKNLILTVLLCLTTLSSTAAEPMKIVYFDSYPPRSWQENGQMKGILVDIANEAIQKRAGIPLIHEGYPWARAQKMVETGLADAFITVPTAQRRAYTVVSEEPVIQFNLYIATYKDNPNLEQLKAVTSIDELKPFTLVDYYGNGFAERRLKDHQVEWLPNIASVYPFLAEKKAEVLLVSDRGLYDLNRLGYQDRIITLPQAVFSLSFHLCISKLSSYTESLPAIDEALRQTRNAGLIQQINQKYYD